MRVSDLLGAMPGVCTTLEIDAICYNLYVQERAKIEKTTANKLGLNDAARDKFLNALEARKNMVDMM